MGRCRVCSTWRESGIPVPGRQPRHWGWTSSHSALPWLQPGYRPLPRTLVVAGDEESPTFEGPYIVKPRFGGSSIGIEVADDWETVLALFKASRYFAQGAVVEPFLGGSARSPSWGSHLSPFRDVGRGGTRPFR